MTTTRKIQEERVRDLNEEGIRDGNHVLYWLQSSHRVLEHNRTLQYAVQRANELDQRLRVIFDLTDGYPDPTSTTTPVCSSASKGVEEALRRRGIKFVVHEGSRRTRWRSRPARRPP